MIAAVDSFPYRIGIRRPLEQMPSITSSQRWACVTSGKPTRNVAGHDNFVILKCVFNLESCGEVLIPHGLTKIPILRLFSGHH